MVVNFDGFNIAHDRSVEGDAKMRKLGVMFRDLRVVGLGVGAAVQHNLASPFYPKSIIKFINTLWHPPVRDIISGFEGVVLPGEMLRAYTSFTGVSSWLTHGNPP